jgi:hypothetical protein
MHLKALGNADVLLTMENITVARMSVKTCYEIRGKFTLKRKKYMTSTQKFRRASVQLH